MPFNLNLKKINIRYILSFLLFLSYFTSFANTDTLTFFGSKPAKQDTIYSLNVINNFKWRVKVYSKEGIVNSFTTTSIDTFMFRNHEPEGLLLSTTFLVDSNMLNKVKYLFYSTNGSFKVLLNNTTIASDGIFNNSTKYTDLQSLKENYISFVLTQPKNNLQVLYLPNQNSKIFSLHLRLGEEKWAKENQLENQRDEVRHYAVATFYFSFAVVLILFYFFIRNKEYLFFGLYCLATAIQYLTNVLTQSPVVGVISTYSFLISLELLAIFMALAINNINKTKTPLLIMCLVMLIALLIPNDIIFTINFVRNIEIPVITVLSSLIFFSYSIFSFAYHWVQGFGQKKWDVKVLTYGTALGLILLILPIIYTASKNMYQQNTSSDILTLFFTISPLIYPIMVAIVLARRYGQNQQQLIEQVVTIKKLGEENLLKETEKKNILAQQNILLENKVTERTFELEEKNKEILSKNKEITDSLIYAKRIQAAVLPNLNTVYKILDQSFILYIPKDIVSGDFYEFTQKNNKHIIAAADCTGHGVAGAFMSIIGSSLIKSIINEKNITTPSGILDALNEGIIHSLKQHESETHDGMDISICSLDTEKMSLEFAGANRPLWLIRNSELIVYTADKFPIGGLQIKHNNQFTNHQIKIQQKDTIYLFSDGYADQFGGEQGKKLMTKKLKEILVSIQHLGMSEQKVYLQNYFNAWKGNHEQVDDVLIIGIRV